MARTSVLGAIHKKKRFFLSRKDVMEGKIIMTLYFYFHALNMYYHDLVKQWTYVADRIIKSWSAKPYLIYATDPQRYSHSFVMLLIFLVAFGFGTENKSCAGADLAYLFSLVKNLMTKSLNYTPVGRVNRRRRWR